MMRTILYLFATAAMLASCAGAVPESALPPLAAPQSKPIPKPLPPTPAQLVQPEGHWTDWPITPGNWVYRKDDRGSIGYFGETGKNAVVTLRCDTSRGRIYLSREGTMLGPEIMVRTSSTSKAVPAASAGGTPPYVASELSPVDPILDAMAYSRGRVSIEASGHSKIAIPAWAEISRIIEDCRA
jgi:hypothetical protein